MRRVLPLVLLLLLSRAPADARAAPWNFFAERPKAGFVETVKSSIQKARARITERAGRLVSAFRLPDFRDVGIRPRSAYEPPRVRPSGFRAPRDADAPRPLPGDRAPHDHAHHGEFGHDVENIPGDF